MRRLFKRTRVLLPLLALLALPATGFGQRSWDQRLDTIPSSKTGGNPAGWTEPFQTANLTDWKRLAAATSKWHSNPECQAAMRYTRDALDNADIRQSIPYGGVAGELFINPEVIVISAWLVMGGGDLGTLIEEAWHRSTGDTDADIDELNVHLDTMYAGRSLQSCHDEAREEEEDDPPSDPGGTTCTDEPYTYRELDWVWAKIEAGSCVGVSPVALPGEEPGEPELHCTPAKWGYVLMEVEKTGVRTVCVPTSN